MQLKIIFSYSKYYKKTCYTAYSRQLSNQKHNNWIELLSTHKIYTTTLYSLTKNNLNSETA